jgi:hypothetical protein
MTPAFGTARQNRDILRSSPDGYVFQHSRRNALLQTAARVRLPAQSAKRTDMERCTKNTDYRDVAFAGSGRIGGAKAADWMSNSEN